ncbi:MAG: AMP-binding protein [Candidatus Nanopelagicales bacterium]
MPKRTLTRLTVEPGPDGVLALAAELPDALNGAGPAIAPIPVGPPSYVQRVLAAVRPDDPSAPLEHENVAVVVTTSGSMGEPRGVLLPGSALIASAKATNARLGDPARWVIALPAHHVAGLQVLVRAHLSGIPPVPLDSVGGAAHFSAEEFAHATRAARAMADVDGSALRTALVPTQLARIVATGMDASDTLTAYDTILLGGAAAPRGLIRRAVSLGAHVVTTYGMTETSGGCVYDGTPLNGVTVKIADADEAGVGRVEIMGAIVGRGYRLRPDLTATLFSPGLHRTSDLGRIDDLNRLEIVGRIDDVVQVGGINVSVSAVEAAVNDTAEVSEAAVVAVPDDQWGSKLTAFVVPDPTDPTAGDRVVSAVVSHSADVLGAEARPRQVVVVATLPTLPAGKVDRAELRKAAAARIGH